MRKRILCLLFTIATLMTTAALVAAQKPRASVPASEVNGTFKSYYKGKFKSESNDLKIWALGGGKLHIAFDLLYPFVVTGELSANMGFLDDIVPIKGDTAVYESTEFGTCKITIKFVKPGTVKVTQEGSDADCGFGHNVFAWGTYKKVSSKKPKFDTPH